MKESKLTEDDQSQSRTENDISKQHDEAWQENGTSILQIPKI